VTPQIGKQILTHMMHMSHPALRKVWAAMTKPERDAMFGNGHAKEVDTFVRSLGKNDSSHLEGHAFGLHLHSLNSEGGFTSDEAAAVLHTPSGVRLAHRALTLNPNSEAFRSTLGILSGRMAAEMKKS